MVIVVKRNFILIQHVKTSLIKIVFKHKIILYVINVLILIKEMVKLYVVN